MMPKSTATSLPSSSTNRLPGCMSAWKKPSRSAWRRKVWITARPSALQVEALGFERGAVGERRAVDPFERQHVARGASPSRPPARGNPDRPWCSPPSRRARRPRAAGPSRSRPSGASVSTISISRSRRASAESCSACARGEGEGVEIGLEAALDARPQHLHGDRPARAAGVSELGAMHLRDRGGGDRRAERGEERRAAACRRRAAIARLGLGLRERRHLVLQALEVARERDADHVRARRQELAELHIGRTEPGQRGGQPVGGDLAGRPLDQPRQRERAARRQRQRRRIDQGEHALAREHEAGARETGEMGERGDHLESFRWSSLPGSTRQSISFARCSCEEGWTPGSSPG